LARITQPLHYMLGPSGRKAVRNAVDLARSEQGRKLASDAQAWARGPEARRLADYGVWAAATTRHAVSTRARDGSERVATLRAALARLRP
jgi:hypothetical protein